MPVDDQTSPVGVLLDAKGRVVRVVSMPGVLPEYCLAPLPKLSATQDEGPLTHPPIRPRRFRLDPSVRAPGHRWWRVYNGGRSMTPEDGYVYRELPHAD